MQSYLQYRRIGQAVRKQFADHPEWGQRVQGESTDTSGNTSENDETVWEKRSGTRPLALPPGVQRRDITDSSGTPSSVFLVSWEQDQDPMNPRNYSMTARITATLIVSALAFAVGAASSIESAVIPQNAAAFNVSEVVASLATGLYLLGFAAGSLVSGPLSEILGRNAVYIGSLTLFMIFIMASGLAPNIGAQLAFRFLAGVFGCPPLTCAGGTIADLWNPLEKTLTFPLYAILSFGGPVFGPVIASYMGQGTLSWRWTNWIMLIMSGLVMGLILLLQPETYGPLLLKWKAAHLRQVTGDKRYRSAMDVQKIALVERILGACKRQFSLTVHEPIILLISLYMTVIYIVLFTFFDGYPFIFQDVYGLSQGLTNIVWVAMYVGIAAAGLWVPVVYGWTKREFEAASSTTTTSGTGVVPCVTGIDPNVNAEGEQGQQEQEPEGGREEQKTKNPHPTRPENRLWFAMLGAPFIPIGLFWMGWTDYEKISIWSPILASTIFGFGTITVFISSYMYVIDSYDIYAASALGFMTVSRYCAAGGMTVVGIPFYRNLGVQYTLTILACISVLMTPVPYVFWFWGSRIRGMSRFAVSGV
ncbi:major facilitator superfamily domain-containing protein [Aspergillus minisclerotigenes]|uniref:Major facilitator superfamily domain-containing protein n=1 Tax=Aspergillus minisclerotigenes TaxID=656917 RepID=A0A5N6JEA6_9EURO|nr:major facilitator superfamily domain-containing protein [Aspergillus minisclerotigenes]